MRSFTDAKSKGLARKEALWKAIPSRDSPTIVVWTAVITHISSSYMQISQGLDRCSQNPKQGSGNWRTAHCQRSSLRPSKEPGCAQVHRTCSEASESSEEMDGWNSQVTIHHIWEVVAVCWSFHSLEEEKHNLPFLKREKNQDLRNYRPVSLISVTGKIMEQLLVSGDWWQLTWLH